MIISIIMIIIGISTSFLIQTDFGNVNTTEVDFFTENGVRIHSTLQVPKSASSSNPRPGVVIIHGVYQSKEWLRAFGVELSRRGFIALTIDAASHGNSGYTSYDSDRGGVAALKYLDTLPYVSKIGIVGHSMGAGIAMQALNLSSLTVDSVVFVGGGARENGTIVNGTNPNNLLITVGKYDELFDIQALYTTLAPIFGSSSPIESGQLYGNFTDGSARKLILGQTNHLFETIDSIIVSETIDWLNRSLFDSTNPEWIAKGNLSYPFLIIGGVISTLGLILSIFPLMAILVDFSYFNGLKEEKISEYSTTTKNYWIYGALYALITFGSFIPALIFSSWIPFPQNIGASVGIWLLVGGILAMGALILIKKYQIKKEWPEIAWVDFGVDTKRKKFLSTAGKSLLLGVIVFLWMYGWTLVVDIFLALDFSAFLPLFNDLPYDPPRLQIAPLYLIFTIPFFLVEGIWIMGLLRTKTRETWMKTQFSRFSKAIIIKCGIYVLILFLQLFIGLILGKPFISGMFGFYLLFFWEFTPFFIITTAISTWSYSLTKRVYIGAMLNALLFSWTLASILTLAI
ncbi:MAG: alpha/beta fold hydrolase [Candidatus Hodarchaeales archaeon]